MKKTLFCLSFILLVGAGCLSSNTEPVIEEITTTTEENVIEENIVLNAPENGMAVTSPLTVSGSARAFENTIDWAIVTEDGDILQSGFITTDAPDVGEFGDFEERIFLEENVVGEVVLEVFTISARDGSKQDVIQRNLSVEELEKTSVNVYFLDPLVQSDDGCGELDLEKRTVLKTVNVAELAIRELLNGPQSDWGVTAIPDGTDLQEVKIENGLATVEFTSTNITRWSGGACHVTALRKQIEQTLLQFPSVDRVEIFVNGNSEDILQP